MRLTAGELAARTKNARSRRRRDMGRVVLLTLLTIAGYALTFPQTFGLTSRTASGTPVRVVDAGTGEPVAGAPVSAFTSDGRGIRQNPGFLAPQSSTVVTNARGEVHLELGSSADGWTLEVGERFVLEGMPEADGAPSTALDAMRGLHAFQAGNQVRYDPVKVSFTRLPVPVLRVQRTRIATVEVRTGSKEGPPAENVMIWGPRQSPWSGNVLGTTDVEGKCSIYLPVSGSIPVQAQWRWTPFSTEGPDTKGTLDAEHLHLVLVAAPRRAIRFQIEDPSPSAEWTTTCRRVGGFLRVGTTRSTRPEEALVDPEEPSGRFDVFVDGGDEAGRGLFRDVECPSSHTLVPARGPKIRVALRGVDPLHPYAAMAEVSDWVGKRIVATGDGVSSLVLHSVPPGRWRVVVARAEDDSVGRVEHVVDVGDAVIDLEIDVSKE